MLKKRLYNVVCYEDGNISAQDEWSEIVPRGRLQALTADKVYIYIKKEKNSKSMTIYLGNEICKLLNFSLKDYIKVSLSKNNPCIIRLSKAKDSIGYSLYRGSDQSTTLRLSFGLPKELECLRIFSRSVEGNFDFLNDNSLILNLSHLKE